MTFLRISTWNANGVSQHKLELAQFLLDNHIDVMLLSETLRTSTIFNYEAIHSTKLVIQMVRHVVGLEF